MGVSVQAVARSLAMPPAKRAGLYQTFPIIAPRLRYSEVSHGGAWEARQDRARGAGEEAIFARQPMLDCLRCTPLQSPPALDLVQEGDEGSRFENSSASRWTLNLFAGLRNPNSLNRRYVLESNNKFPFTLAALQQTKGNTRFLERKLCPDVDGQLAGTNPAHDRLDVLHMQLRLPPRELAGENA